MSNKHEFQIDAFEKTTRGGLASDILEVQSTVCFVESEAEPDSPREHALHPGDVIQLYGGAGIRVTGGGVYAIAIRYRTYPQSEKQKEK